MMKLQCKFCSGGELHAYEITKNVLRSEYDGFIVEYAQTVGVGVECNSCDNVHVDYYPNFRRGTIEAISKGDE